MVQFKILLLTAVAVVVPVFAEAQVVSGNLEVTFQNTPLFSESSVVPGTVVARTVTVKNLGSDTEAVYTSLQNATSTGLSDFMELSINDGGGTVHLATTTFSTLFSAEGILEVLFFSVEILHAKKHNKIPKKKGNASSSFFIPLK